MLRPRVGTASYKCETNESPVNSQRRLLGELDFVRLYICPSSVGEGMPQQLLASYVINDSVTIDAGCVGLLPSLEAQRRIRTVFLSHSHLDHIASLPLFIEHAWAPEADGPPVTVYGSCETLDCLRTNVFNDRVWPDMIRLSKEETPFVHLEELEDGRTVRVADVAVTPVALDHTVPSFGFVIEDAESAIVIVSDTAPTEQIWNVANATSNLKAVFLEASFPESMSWLARRAHHLTPRLFLGEVQKLKHDVRLLAIHVKPSFAEDTIRELYDLGLQRIEIAVSGQTYEF